MLNSLFKYVYWNWIWFPCSISQSHIISTPGKKLEELGLKLNGYKWQVFVVKVSYKLSIHSCSYYRAPVLNHHLKECNLFLIFVSPILPQQNKLKPEAWKSWGRMNIFLSYFPINWGTGTSSPAWNQLEDAFEVPHSSQFASDIWLFILRHGSFER